jgi:hypothetical protein
MAQRLPIRPSAWRQRESKLLILFGQRGKIARDDADMVQRDAHLAVS